VLRCVSDYGEDYQPDEGFADGRVGDQVVYAAHEEFGTQGDEEGGDYEENDGGSAGYLGFRRGGFWGCWCVGMGGLAGGLMGADICGERVTARDDVGC